MKKEDRAFVSLSVLFILFVTLANAGRASAVSPRYIPCDCGNQKCNGNWSTCYNDNCGCYNCRCGCGQGSDVCQYGQCGSIPRSPCFRALYAIVIAGGSNQPNNWARYWNDIMFMFDVLTSSRYKYLASQTYVLYANGNPPSGANCADPGNAVAHANVIDFAATDANLRTVFNNLASSMSSYSTLFIFTSDHGDRNQNTGNVNLVMWGTVIWDWDFAGANYLGRITNYQKEIIVMGQCFSGGFVNDITNTRRIIETACLDNQVSWACDTEGNYDEFLYHFMSAVNWRTPAGVPVNADTNSNGSISMFEAFTYALNHDSRPETPVLDDPGNIARTTTLTR